MPPFLFVSSYHIFAACRGSRPKEASGPDIGANRPMVISVSVRPGSAARAPDPIKSSDVAVAATKCRMPRVLTVSPLDLLLQLKITDQIGFQASSNALRAAPGRI